MKLINFLPNETIFDRWYGCFLILGPKHCFLGHKVWFWDILCYFWVYTYSINKQICFLYFPNFITQFAILFITTYRKFENANTWSFQIRLIYINFNGKNWHFLPYLVKNSFFGSNYKMKALNFTFYMSYWSLSNFLPKSIFMFSISPHLITQWGILLTTTYRKLNISSTCGFKARLNLYQFWWKFTFFKPYLVKNHFFCVSN